MEDYFLEYFGSFENENIGVLDGIKYESRLYFKFRTPGGYCSLYCNMALDEENLKNDADLSLFDLLLQIDIENGAEPTKILNSICLNGAFGAVKAFMKVRVISKTGIQLPFR